MTTTDATGNASPVLPVPHKPRVGNWSVIGGALGLFGYVAITGSACVEALAALIIAIIAGTTWAIVARRRRLSRYGTFFAGLLFLGIIIAICGLVGRSLAAGIVFRAAFNQPPSSAVTFVQTQRFGMMDNTGVLVMKTDKATLDKLLTDAGFKRCEKVEERLRDDPSAGIAPDERQFQFRHGHPSSASSATCFPSTPTSPFTKGP